MNEPSRGSYVGADILSYRQVAAMWRAAGILVCAMCFATAWASESYHPPEGGGAWQKATLYLKPTGPFKEASGAVVFACNTSETFHRSYLYAKGVRAGALYTLWLVEMDGHKVKRSHQLTSNCRW